MRVYFATHSTSVDNEVGRASGWLDAALSEQGIRQAKELGRRFESIPIGIVYCSDLRRAYDTARIAFADRLPIVQDARLRETDYGDMSGLPRALIFSQFVDRISTPFPNGENCEQAVIRVHEFLRELLVCESARTILIIGHRVTYYGLETFDGARSLHECVTTPFEWQPHWTYDLG